MKIDLPHPDASISVYHRDGKHVISVEPRRGLFILQKSCETSYPLELIEHILRVKGPAYLCDEIRRDEDPLYVQHNLEWEILSYVGKQEFAGRRVLDFGSGSGASSVVLARMFPQSNIVGVEMVPEFLELARRRAQFYGVDGRVSFHLSPDAGGLPREIGEFDFIIFSAVYEHLLPPERQAILPLLWSHLKQDGMMFLNQTPYRWFPVEMHTTGLPLVNYLPDRLALNFSRRFSRRVSPDASWPELLRKGIRGGSVREILEILNQEGRKAELLEPALEGVKDSIDLWYKSSTLKPLVKKSIMWGVRAARALTGATMTPSLSLAIRRGRNSRV